MTELARSIAAAFESRWVQGYIKGKLKHDPVYDAASRWFNGSAHPILDVGCGVGLLSHFLAARGAVPTIYGFDFDEQKVVDAKRAARKRRLDAHYFVGDARSPLRINGSVAMLDVLHYFSDADQRRILENAASCVTTGGILLIRDCLRDRSWRYRVTQVQESFSRVIGWLRGDRLNFPSREFITETLLLEGLREVEVTPLWKGTPFNNYLLVFGRQ